MHRRRLALLVVIVAATFASWVAWGGRQQKAHAATEDTAADNDETLSPAEYRYRMSQANHWRAYMLKR
jgi:hypothetical protein